MMKIIGVMTEDFKFFYQMVRLLKKKDEPFISLGFDDIIPAPVDVIITTPEEMEKVDHPNVVANASPKEALDLALCKVRGGEHFKNLVVGIDPGSRTGISIMGDGKSLIARVYRSPERLAQSLEKLLNSLDYERLVIKIGHGDRTNRDRIVVALWDLGVDIEMVDETSTTRRSHTPDIDAARSIALSKGERILSPPEVVPTKGEVKDIKRLSRIESQGRATISSHLAERVAKGELTLKEAIRRHSENQ